MFLRPGPRVVWVRGVRPVRWCVCGGELPSFFLDGGWVFPLACCEGCVRRVKEGERERRVWCGEGGSPR